MAYIRIRKHYLHLPYLVLGCIEMIGHGLIAHFLSSLLTPAPEFPFLERAPILSQTLFYAVIMGCCALSMGVYGALTRESFTNMVLRTIVSFFLLGSLAFTLSRFVVPGVTLHQTAIFWSIIASFFMVMLTRVVFSRVIDSQQLRRNVVIYGSGNMAGFLVESAAAEGLRETEIVGCIGESFDDRIPASLHMGIPDDWSAFTQLHNVSEIVVAQDERRKSEGGGVPLYEFLLLKLRAVSISEAVSFYEREFTRMKIPLLSTSWMLYSDGFRYSKSRDVAKRMFDLAISGGLCILLAPFMLLTAIAVYLESGGPVLYHQNRVGYNGKNFRIYKFRSMRQDAEKGGKAIWASKNDSRVTRVGAVIRNTRLDELPQLYNVIRGEMSFVGPRPERPEFVKALGEKLPHYDIRHTVKPGLMGWAQLKYPYGASEEDAKNKLEYDLYYTKNHSFLMDLLIMIQTVEVVLLGKGVH
ncbi:TIGR03013 family XrtA/PEP-CTERM system glycosyltransferase [Teredinibacter purpureus]|uniref:TIGR03013 family XrtA/PEP-CTERM system glycosyltransferase n=1 Tax=Teredinibacter purpureus TaxID=2731756 RepID=UPI0005F8476B|nr:TIGR03013 family XrtA/PEP-CTERM system glycosyltransferase [Teredinibacter purpureus]